MANRGMGRVAVWGIGVGLLALGVAIGYRLGWAAVASSVPSAFNRRQEGTRYSWVDPLLACISVDQKILPKFKNLHAKIVEVVARQVAASRVARASVYFRELATGQWAGVEEDEKFYPASLLKVPVMMALYKQAESDRAVLKRKIVYRKTAPSNTDDLNSSTTTNLKEGVAYSVDELVGAMIVDSDNNAKDLLEGVTDAKVVSDLFGSLDVPIPRDGLTDSSYGISPRQYSLFMRVLYNATFLNPEMSEKALELLSRASFKDGLVKTLPDNARVAHKFGVYNLSDSGKGLHDCGIIYSGKTPYMMCIMTQGSDYLEMEKAMGEISGAVYGYVQSH